MSYHLTFDNTIDSVTVNGNTVQSGYELHDGDVIVARKSAMRAYIICNEQKYGYDGLGDEEINVTDEDIYIQGGAGDGSSR